MKSLAKLAVALAVTLVLLWLSLFIGGYMWLAIPAFIIVVFFVAARRASFKTAVIAGVIGYLVVLGPSVVRFAMMGDHNTADDPDCDGFCMTTSQAWMFFLFIVHFIAIPVGVASALLATVVAARRRPTPSA
jgi:hypothetical protein